jgi:transformation/transcription domain-associated protein
LIVALLNDGVHMYISHLPKHPENGGSLSQATENSLARFAESMNPNHLKYKDAFEEDFINSKPNLFELVERFRSWRDHLETLLNNRPKMFYLEHFAPYLVEFEHSKFDDIEVPGQYYGV